MNGDFRQSWLNYLKDRYEGLSPSARIFLAGAEAVNAGNSQPLAVLDEAPDWSLDTLAERVSSLESEARNQALRLLVWTEVDPLSERAQKLAEEVAETGRNGNWRNTQENGLAVFALGSYLTKSDVGKPYWATLTDAGGREFFKAGPNDVASARPAVDGKPLKLTLTGQGRPYYSLTVGGVPLTAPEPKSAGLELTRTW
ncbi:MAG: hypothetical protein LBV79_01375, partial [Candidatus Adiutrix sp.]|nr:hypothetical protein [Candidatus Adiutrix sp.]